MDGFESLTKHVKSFSGFYTQHIFKSFTRHLCLRTLEFQNKYGIFGEQALEAYKLKNRVPDIHYNGIEHEPCIKTVIPLT